MKILFWPGLVIECLAMVWFFYKSWLIYAGKSGYVEEAYPELYRQNLVPAAILLLIVSGALLARLWFKTPKVATWIVLSPALIFAMAIVGMLVSSMFIRNWR